MRTIRTNIAGLGSAGSLLGAVIVAFVAVGAIVAFDGLPSATAGSDAGTVVVDNTNAPEIAAASAAGPGSAAPSATPLAAPASLAAPDAAGAGTGSSPGSGQNGNPPPGQPPGEPPVDPPVDPPVPPPDSVPVGDTAGAVNEVNDTVKGATGIDLGLGDTTKGLTDVIDGTIKDITGGRGLGVGKTNLPDLPKVIDLGGGR